MNKEQPATLTTPTEYIDGGPAFPVEVDVIDNNGSHIEQSYGMTLRDYFAAAVAGQVWAREDRKMDEGEISYEQFSESVARIPYEIADGLIKRRNEGE